MKHKKYGKGGHRNLSDLFETDFYDVIYITGWDLLFVLFTSSPNIFYQSLLVCEKPKINSCQVKIVEDAILCVTSWHYDVGTTRGYNYMLML